jgi:hypothetical protein
LPGFTGLHLNSLTLKTLSLARDADRSLLGILGRCIGVRSTLEQQHMNDAQ